MVLLRVVRLLCPSRCAGRSSFPGLHSAMREVISLHGAHLARKRIVLQSISKSRSGQWPWSEAVDLKEVKLGWMRSNVCLESEALASPTLSKLDL